MKRFSIGLLSLMGACGSANFSSNATTAHKNATPATSSDATAEVPSKQGATGTPVATVDTASASTPQSPAPTTQHPLTTPVTVKVPACKMTAVPPSIAVGDSSKLTVAFTGGPVAVAQIAGVSNLSLGASAATATVAPVATRTYTATVTGSGGSASCTLNVSVTQPVPQAPTYTLTVTNTTVANPTKLVAIIDDSNSMTEEIQNLRTSMGKFADSLTALKIQFDAALIPTSTIGATDLTNLDPTPTAVALRPKAYSIPVYSTSATLMNAFNMITPGNSENTESLCLAMDAIGRSEASSYDGHPLYFIFMSDANNQTTWNTYNHATGALINSAQMYCQYASANYCDSYPQTSYTAAYSYTQRGMCQAKGLATDAESMPLGQVWSTNGCTETQYTCDNLSSPVYTCSPEENVAGEYPVAGTNSQYCDTAAKFTCGEIVDGVAQSASVPLSTACQGLAAGNQYSSCTADFSKTTRTFAAKTAPQACSGITYDQNCALRTCNVTSYNKIHLTSFTTPPANLYANCSITGTTQVAAPSAGTAPYLTQACPSGAPVSITKYPLTSELCAGAVDTSLLAPGLTYVPDGTFSVTKTVNTLVGFGATKGTMTQATANTNAAAWVQANVPGATLGAVTLSVTTAKQCGVTPPIAANDPLRSDPNFSETMTPAGSMQATPSNFSTFMHQALPNSAISVSAIISDGNHCPGVTTGSVVAGSDYQTLATQTGGALGSVCTPNFDSFMDELKGYIAHDITTLVYSVPTLDLTKLTSVTDSTSGKALALSIDYTVSGHQITFTAGSVNSGDKVVMVTD